MGRLAPLKEVAAARATIDEADGTVLRFLALHWATTASQIPVLLGVSARRASERLRRLEGERLLRRDRVFAGRPAMVTITPRGLRAIGSPVGAVTPSLAEYRHDLGVGWLWLAARDGAFGPLRNLASERELRSAGGRGSAGTGGSARQAGERHRPDLLMTTAGGKRIAVELELTPKGARRLEAIMLGFAGDPQIDAVLYLVPTPALARLVTTAAARAGVAELVHVQRLAPGGIHGAPALDGAPEAGRRTARVAGTRGAAAESGAVGARRTGTAPVGARDRDGAAR